VHVIVLYTTTCKYVLAALLASCVFASEDVASACLQSLANVQICLEQRMAPLSFDSPVHHLKVHGTTTNCWRAYHSIKHNYWLPCREPEALPFCALAYALIGIISTLLIATPGTTMLLMAIAGQT